MKLVLIYRDEATADIAEAMRWYRSKGPGLDERLLSEVLECEAFIIQHPKGAPVVYKHFRQFPLKGFPYVMLFGIWHEELIVYRLFHTGQNPKRKFKRK
jgi:plasmid stabilization system protein ParE